MLKVEDLNVTVEGKDILKGVNLEVGRKEFHVIMGPNGSGKSTLALTIAGHPKYTVKNGKIYFEGEDITALSPNERAKRGIFLAFQHPEEVEGVKIVEFLQTVLNKVKGVDLAEAYEMIMEKLKDVWFREDMLARYINVGFSGGERKRFEILQALLLEPKLLILDEPDSGVDIDSLSVISKKIEELYEKGTSVLLITHYGRILQHLDPSILRVHIVKDGKIVMSGGAELIGEIEERGFQKIFEECGCDE
ncbi:iron ABC transporter ATP-binding protein [Palaeococcus pacificus DY20341]|uniref:Iron ABC transporter ATP-binding protein n=1 Tax=Palaeococcus pacificus DY20341 TaxID=1343739 RepID=A0A075LRE2_9EURY|nr:Fe-S cluster assembly ATPase SufC [Palaeococcus pacificus]AIF68899.1 iron ABC transporter ATP-binding protein [Palaeococcus pacificus DY20341]